MGLIGILRITSASWGRKVLLTMLTSHSACSYTMRLATLVSLPIEILGVIILPVSVEGSHFSSKI